MTWATLLDIGLDAMKTLVQLAIALAATEMLIAAFGGGGPTFRTPSTQRQEAPHNTGD